MRAAAMRAHKVRRKKPRVVVPEAACDEQPPAAVDVAALDAAVHTEHSETDARSVEDVIEAA